ncbi:MAG: type II toxin-antitoxin system prevent-host-death family antitoxin [Verrucomicrobiae bacterium]|nr:type II toxin-antitoxin system prevent-host-death family antitoxin [Verrucomicrobiae bacterium]
MKKSIGAFEAKTHLSQILEDIDQTGAEYCVTKRGRPVAMIVPFRGQDETRGSLLEWSKRIRSAAKAGSPSVHELIDEGRRF